MRALYDRWPRSARSRAPKGREGQTDRVGGGTWGRDYRQGREQEGKERLCWGRETEGRTRPARTTVLEETMAGAIAMVAAEAVPLWAPF